ncbi:cation:proton antiporter domain-containing protein [Sutcliffiella halmapala]|uniref:cation:proton antiporter domain-containing protein n=1 Tax=Sutcliffiella halmapala TaxID=79882 RepID=UPI000994F38A|nr:cation:proton antiporter [Sutcliffiella halmapala]
MFELPIKEPVFIFALAMIIFFIFPYLMKLLRIPGLIGPILAGVIIGPNGFAILERSSTIELLGTVGLLFIIFIAGLEMDLDGFKKYRNRSIVFGMLSFWLPFAVGTLISFLLGYNLAASILIGSILGSHTLLGYPIASRLGIGKSKAITTAVGGSILTDTFSFLILAIIAGAAVGQLDMYFGIKLTISLIVFVAAIFIGTPLIARWFFRNVTTEGPIEFTFVMVMLFAAGSLALLAGIQPILGAFLVGLALNRFIFDQGPLMNRIRFTANAIFIPFFLLSVGMLMDLRVLVSNPKAWILTISIVFALLIGKYSAALLTSKFYGYSKKERIVIFGLTTPQAAGTLASTLVGFNVGLLDQVTVNGMIIMILITCIGGPYLVEKYGRGIALHENQKPVKKGDAPERILIPIANPKTMESLLDLSFVIRQSLSKEQPIYALRVVQRDMWASEGEVAKAEKMLGQAVTYSSGADVPIRVITRVDRNIAIGINRAIAEEGITTLVAGWNGERTTQQKIFGGVIDQVLDQSNVAVLISKLGHPLNTTKRIILVLPNGIDHKPGYWDALSTIKLLATNLGASIYCYAIKGYPETFKAQMREIKPNPPTEVEWVEGWGSLYKEKLNTFNRDDLVVVISARKGTTAWHPQLEKVPEKLAKINPESFIILYPTETKEDLRGTRGTELPKEVLLERDYD